MASSAFKQRFKTACSTWASSPRLAANALLAGASDQQLYFAHHPVERKCFAARTALSGETEQIARQLRAPITGQGNILEILKRATVAQQFMPQGKRRAHDRVERVVDVVSHAGREPANRLHLLRLMQGLHHRSALFDEVAQAVGSPANRDGHEQRYQRLRTPFFTR